MSRFGVPALIVAVLMASAVSAADRVKRPMLIHRVGPLVLEIWTEQDPEWETRLQTSRGAPVFVAETPALTYPPAFMSWLSLPQHKFTEQDFEAAAHGVLHQAAANYGVRAAEALAIEKKSYGQLTGYETVFSSRAQDTPADVRIFCGHQPGRPAVVMQVATIQGKLEHLREHIRRSWTNVRYLN